MDRLPESIMRQGLLCADHCTVECHGNRNAIPCDSKVDIYHAVGDGALGRSRAAAELPGKGYRLRLGRSERIGRTLNRHRAVHNGNGTERHLASENLQRKVLDNNIDCIGDIIRKVDPDILLEICYDRQVVHLHVQKSAIGTYYILLDRIGHRVVLLQETVRARADAAAATIKNTLFILTFY